MPTGSAESASIGNVYYVKYFMPYEMNDVNNLLFKRLLAKTSALGRNIRPIKV